MNTNHHRPTMPLRGLRAGGVALCLGALLAAPVAAAAPSVATKAPELQELLTQARAHGRVSVIITLSIDDADAANPTAIQSIQQRLLTELASFSIENVKTYRYLPMLAFSVEPVAVGYLLASPLVKTIQLDKAVSPRRPGALPADR